MSTSKVSSLHLETVVVELAALEDLAQEMMDHICKNLSASSSSAFRAQCDGLIQDGALRSLVDAFIDGLVAVAPASSTEDMAARFSILFCLAKPLPDFLTDVVPKITKVVLALPEPKAEVAGADAKMRMEVLKNLYTIVDPKSATRYETLKTMVKFAIKNSMFSILLGTAANDIEELIGLWNSPKKTITDAQKRDLFKLFCDLAEKRRNSRDFLNRTPEEIKAEELKEYTFLVKLLDTFEIPGLPDDELNAVSAYAARAATISIKYPLPGDMAVSSSLEEQSLAGMTKAAAAVLAAEQQQKVDSANLTASPSALAHYLAVQHLQRVPQYRNLSEFLHIFSALGLNEYLQFVELNPNYIKELGLDEETCLKNIRLLTLASLASHHETVTYDSIATKLQVEQDQVETWVITGIVSKLIDAKMDQLNRTIVINRGSQRLLTEDQWKQVQGKLEHWKTNVRALLQTVQSARKEQQ